MAIRKRGIDYLSAVALHLECVFGDRSLGTATGFCIQHEGTPFLITNWHVVTGLNPHTGQPRHRHGGTPDALVIRHHVAGRLGVPTQVRVPLRDDTGELWREHPSGQAVDVVALPLSPDPAAVDIHPLDLAMGYTDMAVVPSDQVSVIGFPLGLGTAGTLPIWVTGHVASDIDVDYQGLPAFLVDASTAPGMSGSPVVARKTGGYTTSSGEMFAIGGGPANRFMGVYSGRLLGRDTGRDPGGAEEPFELNIGIVWKPEALAAVLGNTRRP